MSRISYVDPATVEDEDVLRILERARVEGTPRPESQAIRAHNPPVMKAFDAFWDASFRNGRCDHEIKELCRLYIAESVKCEYCAGQRSRALDDKDGTERKVSEILRFDISQRFSPREKAALTWAMAIAWDADLIDDAGWERLHSHFSEDQLVELGQFIALTLGQQRFLKTLRLKHGEVMGDTLAGLAPAQAEALSAQRDLMAGGKQFGGSGR